MDRMARIIFILMCVSLKASVGIPLSVKTSRSARSLPEKQQTLADLGVDMTDDFAPPHLVKALVAATTSNDTSFNQYVESAGAPRLRKALAAFYSRVLNRELDWKTNVLSTIGASEALFATFEALIEAGDEWIIVEPFFSKFEDQVKLARGIPRFTSMKLRKTSGEITGADWYIDKKELASLFNNKTRGIIINNPNNPTGHVLTLDEIEFIADLAKKHDTYVISDDAHEHILFDPVKTPFIRISTLPGMWNRTITVGSASKSFTVAGWRIGWAYGPANLIKRILKVHTTAVQSVATPQQEAIAFGFEEELRLYGKPESYFVSTSRRVKAKHDFMYQAFLNAGMLPIRPDGGYCMLAKWPSFNNHTNLYSGSDKGLAFENFMSQRINVIGFTMSDYYTKDHRYKGEDYMRFCLEKRKETLQKAAGYLRKLRTF